MERMESIEIGNFNLNSNNNKAQMKIISLKKIDFLKKKKKKKKKVNFPKHFPHVPDSYIHTYTYTLRFLYSYKGGILLVRKKFLFNLKDCFSALY